MWLQFTELNWNPLIPTQIQRNAITKALLQPANWIRTKANAGIMKPVYERIC